MSFIDVNGVSLRYDVQGGGKPIVLIHEMGGSLESWDLVTPLLTPKRRVIRYDKRGMGQSEKIRPPLTIDTMTDDLIGLLDALGVSEKVPLVGTAVGSAIALHTAVRFPGRIAAVIATSPAISLPAASRHATLERVARFEREGVRVAFEATANNGYPEELRSDKARFAGFRARWLANDPISFGAIYRMLGDMDLFGELGAIRCPVLVIGGEFDRGRPPSVVSRSRRAFRARSSRCCRPGIMRDCRRRSWWRRRSRRFWRRSASDSPLSFRPSAAKPVIGPRFARTRWRRPGMTAR